MDVVTKCVNFCRKQGLNHRQFKVFLDKLEADYSDIPFYCSARWLICAKVLKIFFALINVIQLFMDMKLSPQPILQDKVWVSDLAFMTDITGHLSDLNISLQGKDKLVSTLSNRIDSFQQQILLFKNQLSQKKLDNFPSLQSLNLDAIENLDEYQNALQQLYDEFASRYKELENIKPELRIFMTPFSVRAEDAPSNFQIELIKLQCDAILKDRYYHFNGNLISFYKGVSQQEYPKLHALALRFVAMFGTTFVCEQMFSVMNLNKSKSRSCLSEASLEAILRIATAKSIVPNIGKLVAAKRCQKS